MSDQPLHMWNYWKDDKGRIEALIGYYPKLATTNPILSAALAQIRVAQKAIDAEMKDLREKELDAEEETTSGGT